MTLNEKNLSIAFKLFDKDNSGTIDADEVSKVLGKNLAAEESIWEDVIREIDINGDGKIDFYEFCKMIKTLATRQELAHLDSIEL